MSPATPSISAAVAEPVEHRPEPSLRNEWVVLGLLALAPLAVVLVIAGAGGGAVGIAAALGVTALLGFAVFAGATSVHRRWRYLLWSDAIEVRHGVIRHVATFLPFHRIQQVDIERGPLDRAFGLSTLIIRSAAASTDAKVPGLDPSVVEDLRQSLLERADLDDAV
jgi:membrane protein YdbS with pleckstrin-like domain